jgi:uncharacterized protein (DUF305 family)
VVDLAGRIDASQADEIAFMQGWLTERGETAPAPMAALVPAAAGTGDHAGHHAAMDHDAHADMAGMATPAQMQALEAARGEAFDQMFLQLMIAHHEGAVKMVSDLLARSGSAYDPVLFRFVNDITNEQQAEIDRMAGLVRERAPDPRSTLRAGFRDAGEAILNMERVASLPKPTGFFDPSNPEGLPPTAPAAETPAAAAPAAAPAAAAAPARPAAGGSRSPFLSFSNTDMAFSGDLLAVGN